MKRMEEWLSAYFKEGHKKAGWPANPRLKWQSESRLRLMCVRGDSNYTDGDAPADGDAPPAKKPRMTSVPDSTER